MAAAAKTAKSGEEKTTMASRFAAASNRMSAMTGSYKTFVLAVAVIVVWAVSGPVFGFSDTWQLVINTGTTIVTFLMVFLIQNTQNRDATAVHLKLDELIRAISTAENKVMAAENVSEAKLTEWQDHYAELSDEHEAIEDAAESVAGDVAALKEAMAKIGANGVRRPA